MRWLDACVNARRAGRSTVLFIGKIGDGFPSDAPDAPADALVAWEDAVLRACGSDGIRWQFDPVRGFVFARPEHEMEFRTLARPAEQAQPADEFAAAHQQYAASDPLFDPQQDHAADALRRMLTVCARAAAAKPPRPCTIVLPNVDAYVPTGAAQSDDRVHRAALAILQFASSDAFRRAGHMLAMSAPTAAAVHERLRRPDAAVETIVIDPPDEAERRGFLAACCTDPVTAAREERARLAARRAEIVHHAREAAEHELATARESWNALLQRGAATEAHPRVRELLAELEGREEILTRVRAQEAETSQRDRVVLTAAVAAAKDALSRAPKPTILTKELWKLIEVGDTIVTMDGSDKQTHALPVIEAHWKGYRILGLDDLAKPITNDDDPIPFTWHGDGIVANVGGKRKCYPVLSQATRIMLVRRAYREARKELVAAETALQALEARAEESGGVQHARQLCELTDATLQEQRRVVRVAWEDECNRLGAVVTDLEARVANPTSDEVHACDAAIVRCDARIAALGGAPSFPMPPMGLDAFTTLTKGLGYRDLTAILRAAAARAEPLSEADVAAQRIALLRRSYGHLFEIIEPRYGFEGLAGLAHVKRVLTRARDAMLAGDRRAVPQGIALMGPPGTGKSAVAEAFGREAGVLLVRSKNLRSKWVGDSEALVEEALRAIRSLAPVVWFRDEADQEDSGRNAYQGDSGVSNRMRQALMEFEADERNRGAVVIVKATNRPDLMDAAMLRDGRADVRLVVITGVAEYAALFAVVMAREGYTHTIENLAPFAETARSRGISGAAVANICRMAYETCGAGNPITAAALSRAIADALPSANPLAEAEMTLAAIAAASARPSLPEGIVDVGTRSIATIAASGTFATYAPATRAAFARAEEILRSVAGGTLAATLRPAPAPRPPSLEDLALVAATAGKQDA